MLNPEKMYLASGDFNLFFPRIALSFRENALDAETLTQKGEWVREVSLINLILIFDFLMLKIFNIISEKTSTSNLRKMVILCT